MLNGKKAFSLNQVNTVTLQIFLLTAEDWLHSEPLVFFISLQSFYFACDCSSDVQQSNPSKHMLATHIGWF